MKDILAFRIHSPRLEKDRFAAMAEHLGLRGDVRATEEALFVQDKERAFAFAQPGSRFAGLLFFTDQSQALGAVGERAPGPEQVEAWTTEFRKRFQLDLRAQEGDDIKVTSALKVLRTDAAVEEGKEGGGVKRVPLKTEVISELKVNGHIVTGPRAKVRMTFKHASGPAWVHHAQWERLEVFEGRPLLTEDEVHRRLSDRLTRRGQAARTWRLLNLRLAYFAGEFSGGPDLLLPCYFAEVEHRNAKDRSRQGPRQLLRLPAWR